MQILLSRITFHMYIYHIHEMLTEYVETEKQCSLYDYPLYQIQLSAFPDQKHNSLPQNFFSLFFFHITLSFYHRLNKVVHEQEDTSILTDLSNQQFRICSTQLGKSGVCEKIQIMHIWLPILPKKYYYFLFELKNTDGNTRKTARSCHTSCSYLLEHCCLIIPLAQPQSNKTETII